MKNDDYYNLYCHFVNLAPQLLAVVLAAQALDWPRLHTRSINLKHGLQQLDEALAALGASRDD